MTTLAEDMAIIQDQLSKLGVQDALTVVLSKADYKDLMLKCRVDPNQWQYAQFMDNHFTWQSMTFRSW